MFPAISFALTRPSTLFRKTLHGDRRFYGCFSINLSPTLSADSAVPGLNRDVVYGIDCVEPNEKLAIAFDDMVKPMLSQIAHNNDETESLLKLRDSLLPRVVA